MTEEGNHQPSSGCALIKYAFDVSTDSLGAQVGIRLAVLIIAVIHNDVDEMAEVCFGVRSLVRFGEVASSSSTGRVLASESEKTQIRQRLKVREGAFLPCCISKVTVDVFIP